MQLPPALRIALEGELRGVPSQALTTAVRDLSQRYRLHDARFGASLLRSDLDALAYAAYRLPATYAAVRAVLDEVRLRRPDLRPKTLLDVGAGPGSVAWAAVEIWPGLERITALERDRRMVKLGTALGGHAHMPAVRRAEWRQLDLTDSWGCEPADITIAAYVVGELWPVTRPRLLRRLWEHASEVCVVVEPGTPRGFDVVRQAGDDLVTAGALVIAPFPQDWQCLEGENDWCHFAQRVPRTRSHRTAKDAVLSYEDEKYSYVVASRRGGSRIAARVVRQPQIRSGHVRLVLCTPAGVRHLVVARSQREAYRRVKDLAWGSAILPEEASLYGLTT